MRSQMSIQELIRTEVHQKADEAAKKQREELKNFLKTRGGLDHDGQLFMAMLEESKMKLGPYSANIAEQFIQKTIDAGI